MGFTMYTLTTSLNSSVNEFLPKIIENLLILETVKKAYQTIASWFIDGAQSRIVYHILHFQQSLDFYHIQL